MINTELLLTIISIALIIDTFVPDLMFIWKFIPHPITILGKMILFIENKLYNDKVINGFFLWIITVTIWGGLGFAIEYTIFKYTDYGIHISIILTTVTIASYAMKSAVKKVLINIDKGNLEKARMYTGYLCARDTTKMDNYECGRSATESMAENFSDGVIAPVFYYCVFGLGGIFAYKAINTLDSMVGYKSDKYKNFGFITAKADDIANYIPARISAFIVVMASIIYTKSTTDGAIQCIKKYAHTHNSPNAGYPESAFAGALKIALGGKRIYPNIGTIEHWIGDGERNITPNHMMRAISLFNISIIITISVISLIAINIY